MKRNFVNVCCA